MADLLCTDNRFELIEKYKKALIESTNIETSSDEMKVIDNVLFRFWQMGWLEKLETTDAVEVVRCKDCKNHEWCSIEESALYDETFFCKKGGRRDDEQQS